MNVVLTGQTITTPSLTSFVDEIISKFSSLPLNPLVSVTRFTGAGLYALYYKGACPLYSPLASAHAAGTAIPIYVGSALSNQFVRSARLSPLFLRLDKHRKNILFAEREGASQPRSHIHLNDFECRYIIMQDAAEDLIIPVEYRLQRNFSPVWNLVLKGFGNHSVGAPRTGGRLSKWDVIHAGRTGTAQDTTAHTFDDVFTSVSRHLTSLIS